MELFASTELWRRAFTINRKDSTPDEQSYFRLHLLGARERVKRLVDRIAKDMPGYTVHDISHLDALWETADLVTPPSLSLNPPEAFVFGLAILLHDAGMSLAAYVDGIDELRNTLSGKTRRQDTVWTPAMGIQKTFKETLQLRRLSCANFMQRRLRFWELSLSRYLAQGKSSFISSTTPNYAASTARRLGVLRPVIGGESTESSEN